MFCTKCGSQMDDNARFCGSCGAPRKSVAAQTEPQQDFTAQPSAAFEMPYEPPMAEPAAQAAGMNDAYSFQSLNEPKKGSVGKVIVIAVVAVALIIALVAAVFASGLLDNDAAKVMKAFAKTAEAYSGVGEELGMPDFAKIEKDQEASVSLSVWIEELEDAPDAEGFGVRVDADTSMSERQMDMIFTPFYGSSDLLDLEVKLDDGDAYVGSPELTGGTYYKFNMETLGDDLADLGAGDELAGFGFNVFELTEMMMSMNADAEEARETFMKSYEDFKDELEISKNGTQTIDVNDYEVKCTEYDLVISQKAATILIDAAEEYLTGINATETVMDMYAAMGMPEDVMDEIEYAVDYDEMFATLRDAVEEMEDVTLQVYVSDGYVMSVVWEDDVEDLTVSVDLGGGSNYADDLSVRMESEGSEMALVSTGNHTGKGGLFTDETELIIDGETLAASSASYDAESDDLFWEIEMEEVCIYIEGQLTTEKDSMILRVDELGVTEYGESLGIAFGLEYSVGTYEGSSIEVDESVELLTLSETEMQAEVEKIMMNAYAWLAEVAEEVPALQEAIAGTMS